MANKRPLHKRILIDIAGFGMLIAVPFVGWIPGPGGIPLLLGGLKLLSINHEWARKAMHEVSTRGTSIYELVFPKNPWINFLYDVLGLFFIFGAIYVINVSSRNLYEAAASITITVGAAVLLANRRRIEKIVAFFQKYWRKK